MEKETNEKQEIIDELCTLYKCYNDLEVLNSLMNHNSKEIIKTNIFGFETKIEVDINNYNNQSIESSLVSQMDNLDSKGLLTNTIHKPSKPSYSHSSTGKKYDNNLIVFLFVFGGLCSFLGLILLVAFLSDDTMKTAVALPIVSLIGGIVCLFVGIKCLGDNSEYYSIIEKNNLVEKKYNTDLKNYKRQLKEYYNVSNEVKRILDYLNEVKKDNEEKCIKNIQELKESINNIVNNGIIPYNYARDPNIVAIMLNIMFNKRADTMKELANTYESDRIRNIIISEIQKSNNAVLNALDYYTETNAYYSEALQEKLSSIEDSINAPIEISGYSVTL